MKTWTTALFLWGVASGPADAQVDPRPLLDLIFEAGQSAEGFADAVHAVMPAPDAHPRVNSAWQDVLDADPMHFDVFTTEADLGPGIATGHLRCLRVGLATRDALLSGDLSRLEQQNVQHEALIYPGVLENWPEDAIGSVFCANTIMGPEPRPEYDVTIAVGWLSARLDDVRGVDAPIEREYPIDGILTDIEASGAYDANGVRLVHVGLFQMEGGTRQLDVQAYILAGTS
ncbi:hypothetical protein [Gymnodinialimonas hymeniacidonis]|uniref:hypothetical protein n=1 Tax=Gymnodinialimonas hymeniacidonis TaxID=3126508 RepID=UPI0034C5C246